MAIQAVKPPLGLENASVTNDGNALQARLDFLKISDKSKTLLKAFGPTLEKFIPKILDDFYAHILAIPGLKEKVLNSGIPIEQLKAAQAKHWKNLFNAEFDHTYMSQVGRIASAHVKIGLEPRWYMAGYSLALNHIVDAVVQQNLIRPKHASELIQAINQAVFLDMDLSISAYFETIIANIAENATKVSSASQDLESVADVMAGNSVKLNQLAEDAVESTHDIQSIAAAIEQSSQNVQQIFQATRKIEDNVSVVRKVADSNTSSMTTLAAATEEMTLTFNTISSAVEEMTSSLNEIARNSSHASSITNKAENSAESAKEVVGGLGRAAQEIGEVIDMIQSIASQTNLLALNATIEAASAGDAGKGFAVVASEVKALAKQSADASEKIRNRIQDIQQQTGSVVHSIAEIASIMQDINQVNTTIASAVEEQTSTSGEISKNIVTAVQAATEISQNIQQTAVNTQTLSEQVTEANATIKEVSISIEQLNGGTQQMSKRITSINESVSNNVVQIQQAASEATQGSNKTKESAEELTQSANKLETVVRTFSKK